MDMRKPLCHVILAVIVICTGILPAAPVILNEYNAVDPAGYLGGGTAARDASGDRASDTWFGRVLGNGGDWFELVVITDHLDMRGWMLDIYTEGALDETLTLTNHSIWSDLRSGTIITVSEDVHNDVSYDPAGGDWWINVRANDSANGLYIENSSFPVSSSDWQLAIKNASGTVVFGPAGEGIGSATGIGGAEVCRLEADPTALVTPLSEYDDADDLSTFGAPNQWGRQSFGTLRTVTPPASAITLISPNGSEVLASGRVYNIAWTYTGTLTSVLVEFSADGGLSWSPVYPANVGNSGVYAWLVPNLDSQTCRVRVSNTGNPGVFDVSLADFAIYQCPVEGDLTGDCIVTLDDFALIADSWLACGNPYDTNCQ
jgi:hypothetical protein